MDISAHISKEGSGVSLPVGALAADLVERSVSETLTYYAFPDIHWQKIRTNNPLERIMKEIRRRTRVVGAFPDGQSCLNLAAARLRYIAGTAWSATAPKPSACLDGLISPAAPRPSRGCEWCLCKVDQAPGLRFSGLIWPA